VERNAPDRAMTLRGELAVVLLEVASHARCVIDRGSPMRCSFAERLAAVDSSLSVMARGLLRFADADTDRMVAAARQTVERSIAMLAYGVASVAVRDSAALELLACLASDLDALRPRLRELGEIGFIASLHDLASAIHSRQEVELAAALG
jgi:hypothetical protein